MSYRLVRKRDGLTKISKEVCYLSFYESGRFKKKHRKPFLGRSLLMSPFNVSFTWQTTLITKIIEKKKNYLHFLTENSEYELFKEE